VIERRVDPLTGEEVVLVAGRQRRPNLPSDGCPFCVGGTEAPEPYDVKAFPTRWPPLDEGRAEVVLYTSEHDASFASLGIDAAARVVDLWAERTSTLGAHDDVDYVLVFENRGPEVGATITHPHGQIYAFPTVPPAARAELEHSDRDCPLCAIPASELAVGRAGGWRIEVPAAATWPYSLLLAPDDHHPDLPSLDSGGRRDLATALIETLDRLDGLFDDPMPLMLWFHQQPTDGGPWPAAHVHAHVAPLLRSPQTPRFVAAGELGSGVFFNPVLPEDAAAAHRAGPPLDRSHP
jgi:UDPglucose--hexose-1-phosphate uridylyltransferase